MLVQGLEGFLNLLFVVIVSNVEFAFFDREFRHDLIMVGFLWTSHKINSIFANI
jgi:hypothetical protein